MKLFLLRLSHFMDNKNRINLLEENPVYKINWLYESLCQHTY